MSYLATTARNELVKQLTSVGMTVADQKEVGKAIFPFVDKLIRHENIDAQSAKPILYSYAEYVKNVHEANKQTDGDFQFDVDYKKDARKTLEERLEGNKVTSVDKLGLDAIEEGLAKLGKVSHVSGSSVEEEVSLEAKAKTKPPKPNAGLEDFKTFDLGKIQDVTENQAGRSEKIASDIAFSKLKNDASQPLISFLDKKDDKSLIEEALEVLQDPKFKGKEASFADISIQEMQEAKVKMTELVNSYDKAGLIQYLTDLDPKLQFAVGNHLKGVLHMMKDDFATVLKASVGDGLEEPLKAAVSSRAGGLASKPADEAPAATALKSRYLLSGMLAFGQELSARLKLNPDYQGAGKLAQEFFSDESLQQLEQNIEKAHGVKVKIDKDDFLSLTKYLGNKDSGVETSKKTQQLDIMEFVKNNKGMVLGAVPMVLGPLTSMFSKLPIVGGLFASVAGFTNNIATQFGPYIFSMFMQGNGKAADTQVESPKDQAQTEPSVSKAA